MGFVVLRGIRLEYGGSNSCANAEAPSTGHASQSWKHAAGVAAKLVCVFTPLLGGGKAGSRLEGFAELLQWLILLLAFRFSLFQKVAGSSLVADESARRCQSSHPSPEEFSLQDDNQLSSLLRISTANLPATNRQTKVTQYSGGQRRAERE